MDRISVRPTLWMETIQTVDMDQYVCDVVFHACIDVSIFPSLYLCNSHTAAAVGKGPKATLCLLLMDIKSCHRRLLATTVVITPGPIPALSRRPRAGGDEGLPRIRR